jgi:hypothetical protein
MIDKVRLWNDSVFEMNDIRKRSLRVPSSVARLVDYLDKIWINQCIPSCAKVSFIHLLPHRLAGAYYEP